MQHLETLILVMAGPVVGSLVEPDVGPKVDFVVVDILAIDHVVV